MVLFLFIAVFFIIPLLTLAAVLLYSNQQKQ